MDNLVLHPKTKALIERFVSSPSHALLLSGAAGIGKSYTAQAVCGQILNVDPGALQRQQFVKFVAPAADSGSLSIDAIRDLRHFLKLKTTGSKALRRVCIIEHADTLTIEAQNALLKILEEPPDDTVLVLTINHPRSLLPTIMSRVREIRITPPEADELLSFFKDNYDQQQVTQAFFLSGGLPGLMRALLDGQDEHPLVSSVSKAKELLKQPLFERLAAVDALSRQKDVSAQLLEAYQRISRAGLHLAAQKLDDTSLRRWHKLYKLSFESSDKLAKNANTKLVLTNLMLQI